MGFFSRLGSMVRGFFGMFVGNLEEKNPELLFEDIKNQVEKARKEAEHQIVEIQTNAELIKIDSAYLTQIEKHGKLPAPDVMSRVIEGLKMNDTAKALLISLYLKVKYPELASMVDNVVSDDKRREMMNSWIKWQEKESTKSSWTNATIPERVIQFEKKNK